ncbi:MAG TPA: hypothetical protein VK561_05980, partial [Bradyrhizobium sp.]|nr:hypothetical protein [Bradyrhizobium sp.]
AAEAVEQDLAGGLPPQPVFKRHRTSVGHPDPACTLSAALPLAIVPVLVMALGRKCNSLWRVLHFEFKP